MSKEEFWALWFYIIIGILVMLLVILVSAKPIENLDYLEKDPFIRICLY